MPEGLKNGPSGHKSICGNPRTLIKTLLKPRSGRTTRFFSSLLSAHTGHLESDTGAERHRLTSVFVLTKVLFRSMQSGKSEVAGFTSGPQAFASISHNCHNPIGDRSGM